MDWIDFEKAKPTEDGYYLCKVWVNSINQYGASSEFHVLFYNADNAKFGHYPVCEYYNGELVEYYKVIWWCQIPKPPINGDHYVLPKPPKDD